MTSVMRPGPLTPSERKSAARLYCYVRIKVLVVAEHRQQAHQVQWVQKSISPDALSGCTQSHIQP